MAKWIVLVLCLSTATAWGQKETQASDAFTVTGAVKHELTFTLDDIEKMEHHDIADVVITNHAGEPRGTAQQLKGVLVKDVLRNLELSEDNPKLLSEFYFVFAAADGYRVVYSWNEIFNSPVGDNLFIITARDGKQLREMKDRILVLTPIDFRTGRRHIKGLAQIVVKRAE